MKKMADNVHREDPLAVLLLTLSRTDYLLVRDILAAIERDQFAVLATMSLARTKLQMPYWSADRRG
jgi:hypothetical protein